MSAISTRHPLWSRSRSSLMCLSLSRAPLAARQTRLIGKGNPMAAACAEAHNKHCHAS